MKKKQKSIDSTLQKKRSTYHLGLSARCLPGGMKPTPIVFLFDRMYVGSRHVKYLHEVLVLELQQRVELHMTNLLHTKYGR